MPASTANPFGRDLNVVIASNGFVDLDPAMSEATGRHVLTNSLICRQCQPLGSNPQWPNDGIDLRNYVQLGMTPAQLAEVAGKIQNQLQRDQRVLRVNVQVTFNASTSAMTVVENFVSSYGPFSLTLAVTSVTVAILEAAD